MGDLKTAFWPDQCQQRNRLGPQLVTSDTSTSYTFNGKGSRPYQTPTADGASCLPPLSLDPTTLNSVSAGLSLGAGTPAIAPYSPQLNLTDAS